MYYGGIMEDCDDLRIDRALEELRQERRRLFDRIKLLVKSTPREAEITGYLRGAENTSEAMLSLAKAYPAAPIPKLEQS